MCLVVIGLLTGAVFVKLASWRWIFWFIAIIALPIAVLSAIFVPQQNGPGNPIRQPTFLQKLNSLDLGGISLLTGTSKFARSSVPFTDVPG